MPPQLNHAQVDSVDIDVQLVFACSGNQVLQLELIDGGEQISEEVVCNGRAASLASPAGVKDEVAFSTDSVAEGAYAYQWYLG